MDSVMNKTRLAEKRYRDKVKKDKKEIRLNTRKPKKQKKSMKIKKILKNTIINYEKQKKTKNYKRKSNMNKIKKNID